MARKKKATEPLETKTVSELVQEFLDNGGTIKQYPTKDAAGAYRATTIGTSKK